MNEQLISSDSIQNQIFLKDSSKEYNYGLDILRIVGMFNVVAWHGYFFNGFVEQPIDTWRVFLCLIGKYVFLTCVPIFLLLSGYLKKNKKVNVNYYSKLPYFIIEYLLSSLIVLIYKVYHKNLIIPNREYVITGFLCFFHAPYSWYVQMYIPLYILSPFLNILYNSLHSSSLKFLLMLTNLLVFSLPYTIYYFGWNYFHSSYPIMYYFFGCFLRDYQPKVNKFYIFIFYIILILLQALTKKYSTMIQNDGHECFFCICTTICVFFFLYDLKIKKMNVIVKIIRKIADTSLSFFLVSYIFDDLFSEIIFSKREFKSCVDKVPYLMFTIPLTFIGSVIMGLIIHSITKIVMKTFIYIITILKECYKGEEKETNENNDNNSVSLYQ